ncbi:MAG TPA: hypothetical protein VGJ68_00615, partial [Bradyrhizobium sp.]
EDGALCWTLEPADGCSFVPVPCALAKPAPAISATAATDIIKRLVIEYLLSVFLARADNEAEGLMFRDIAGSTDFVL